MLLSWFVLLLGTLARLLLGALFDAVKLMAPESLEMFHPVVHGLELSWVQSIHPASATPTDRDDPNSTQHAQVFRHSRLSDSQRIDQIAYRALAAGGEQVD